MEGERNVSRDRNSSFQSINIRRNIWNLSFPPRSNCCRLIDDIFVRINRNDNGIENSVEIIDDKNRER